jgi:hemoglobin
MEPQEQITPFEQVGGQPVIDRLVDRFYDEMDAQPAAAALRALHAPDLTEIRRVLKVYLGEWLGGPRRYSQERGHPRLRAERDAWLACMHTALTQTVADEDARDGIYAAMARLADFMRNRPGEPAPGQGA